jgi:hypothetical protein
MCYNKLHNKHFVYGTKAERALALPESCAGRVGGREGARMSTDYVIATVPNEGDPQDTVARRIKTLLSGNADVFRCVGWRIYLVSGDVCDSTPFPPFRLRSMDLPTNLLVGTLDTLMSLSDDLQRIDSLVENVARKVRVHHASGRLSPCAVAHADICVAYLPPSCSDREAVL